MYQYTRNLYKRTASLYKYQLFRTRNSTPTVVSWLSGYSPSHSLVKDEEADPGEATEDGERQEFSPGTLRSKIVFSTSSF